MSECTLCGKSFDPGFSVSDPAVEAGLLMAKELYGDGDTLCQDCLASRGKLAMMYCSEFYG